jgi:Uma2 family endonuclease
MTELQVPATTTEKLTIEEFVRIYEQEGPFELINGERINLMPVVAGHSEATDILKTALSKHGKAFAETPFVLTYSGDWVTGSRVPDVMFFKPERFEAYKTSMPDWKKKPVILVPDLAVEVVSANDRYSQIMDKVERYLNDGVQLVWVVDLERGRITVCRANGQQMRLLEHDTLTGEDVIPDFEMAVAAIFA